MNTLKSVREKTTQFANNALQPVVTKNREKWWRRLEEDFDLEKGSISSGKDRKQPRDMNRKEQAKTMSSLSNVALSGANGDSRSTAGAQNPLEAAYWRIVWSEDEKERRLVRVPNTASPAGQDGGDGGDVGQGSTPHDPGDMPSSVSNMNALEYFQREYEPHEEESVLFDSSRANGPVSPSRKQRVFKVPPQMKIEDEKNGDLTLTSVSGTLPQIKDTEPFLDLRKENKFMLRRAHARYFCINCLDFPCWSNKFFIVWIVLLVILLYVIVVLGILKLMSV